VTEPDRKGRLVAVCGIDGSGKTTQTRLLADRAESEGLSVRTVSFPRYGEGFFAELIERYLRGEFAARAGEVSPYLAALPYACDRWEVASKLREWLSQGLLVVCNRYVPANMAHQGAKLAAAAEREAFYEWVRRLEYGLLGLPEPDLHVLLDVPVRTAAGLLGSREADARVPASHDIHERDLAYLEATSRAYHEVAARRAPSWAVVRCAPDGAMLPPEKIAEDVWAAVRKILYTDAEP